MAIDSVSKTMQGRSPDVRVKGEASTADSIGQPQVNLNKMTPSPEQLRRMIDLLRRGADIVDDVAMAKGAHILDVWV